MKDQLNEMRKTRIQKDLYEEHKPNKYNFFNFVTRITISKNANAKIVQQLSEFGIVANTNYKI